MINLRKDKEPEQVIVTEEDKLVKEYSDIMSSLMDLVYNEGKKSINSLQKK